MTALPLFVTTSTMPVVVSTEATTPTVPPAVTPPELEICVAGEVKVPPPATALVSPPPLVTPPPVVTVPPVPPPLVTPPPLVNVPPPPPLVLTVGETPAVTVGVVETVG
ncbi:MAG: hypothetical protein EBR82_75645 [Caulobacteraceae bacterium]|nr:hypothetical protein [Caulobacteraceae bacterium]